MASVCANLWRWQRGRQGSGYDKLLLAGTLWPLPCDCYLLRFPTGASVPPHTDRVSLGRHYRLNIILRAPRRGGEFVCARPIHAGRRIKLFRPDVEEHSVTMIQEGTRWVLSIGWVLGVRGAATRPAA
ncbi:hypothetical protein CH75_23890 [Dyella jiangningensis]|nr:hypothetical protein CH75_00810 [Dyella jiangningensis]AHX15942.1 hypothetical protein CH75_23890 [Dyella jiangningensis]